MHQDAALLRFTLIFHFPPVRHQAENSRSILLQVVRRNGVLGLNFPRGGRNFPEISFFSSGLGGIFQDGSLFRDSFPAFIKINEHFNGY